jgi:hypothetical protein
MSTITNTQTVPTVDSATRPRLWSVAVGFGAVAAVATTVVAASAHAAGVSLDVSGEPIPLLAFAQMTMLFSLVGFGIAAGVRRWARDARRTWVRTTVALTVLSFVPDLLADAAVGTRLTLMSTHLVAALIVVPAVAARLNRR